jgi:hypothetical protein
MRKFSYDLDVKIEWVRSLLKGERLSALHHAIGASCKNILFALINSGATFIVCHPETCQEGGPALCV